MPPPPIPKAAIEAAQKKRSSITPQSAPLSVPVPPVPPESHAENCAAGTEQQGEAKGCQDCPNKETCKANKPDPKAKKLESDAVLACMENVQRKVLVLSGKGGVGKSTVTCQLAYELASRGLSIGVLDVDICGPSAPTMFGVTDRQIHHSRSGWSPVYVKEGLSVVSTAFMLEGGDEAVIWRGPRKNGLIKQFLTQVDWGHLDYLLVDTPPGTSDEHISTVQYLRADGAGVDGAIVVTTPEEVSMADVRKELSFCKKVKCDVVGVVENMAQFKSGVEKVGFRSKGGEDVSEKVKEILEKLPLDPNLLACCENGEGFTEKYGEGGESEEAVSALKAIADELVRALPTRQEE
ncbi:hypothetical protein TrRE_jg13641 [Triparma retinervis]|uniref:Cytosolic Fe-S cluster assembly factor NUBP1 homolog n=1 Tax=Triparma retinervis TaxID=2557542 RepID=A0A9W6ZCD9_9STRA|nr:hypothetical protein TrRE_jg13641 [Triparma retinervis]